MIAFKVMQPDVKAFMNKLLREDVFDMFEVRGIDIAAVTKFQISGALDADFVLEEAANRRFCTWMELKAYVYNIIKGGKRPKLIRITFSLPDAQLEGIHANASACFLNIVFEGEEVLCTTGTGEKQFSTDRTVNDAWDSYVKAFVQENNFVISTQLD